jgi:hypothetical protein
MFVGEIIYKDGNYFFKSNLRCQIKSPITLDRCAGHANVNRRFHTSTFSFFFLHGWTIHKFHALGSFKILCKDYVNVCVCVCVWGEKKRDKDKEDKFYYRGRDVVKCQNLELNVCMGIKEIERKKNWCPRHIFSQGEVCPRQTLKAWDRVSWSLPCVYGK